ncbi:MAG: alpha/beta hydrolase [Candidatus Lambdaproteobacteria bacterium]|nr:alpha/beta hydrolase [Candidatus Lambdaproteobacteria bacterium]
MSSRSARIHRGYVDTSVGQIHFREAGRGDGTPIVMLHQTASCGVMFEPLMAELEDEFRMVAPDVPGFGMSDRPAEAGNMPLYARAIHEALQALGIRSCWLFGVHSGAAVAVELEARHPGTARRLVLSGPPFANDDMRALVAEQAKPFVIREDGGHLLEIWARIRAKDPGAPLEWAHTECVNNLHAGPRWHEAYLATVRCDFNTLLPGIACPTLLMAGDTDSLRSSLEPAHAALPTARKIVLPDATTYLCVRRAAAVAGILRGFFQPG